MRHISVDLVGGYRVLLNVDDISVVRKQHDDPEGCVDECVCDDPDTLIIMRNGAEILTSDSINTIEARMQSLEAT